ncbi:hypothetical protein WIT60_11275 [Aquabacterium sp. G14]|uniref:Ig-like domain-containing protein n=1 Tax=Aquabacterium sp. G14 TaxID=3130164 RepID=UPI0030ADC833
MKLKVLIAALSAVSLLVACGGGGGDAGTSPYGGGSGSGTGGVGGGGTVPGTTEPSVPAAMTFESISPTNSLLIQGATAAGRTDTATLTFKVVDQVGAVVAGQDVNFTVSPSTAVTLNITSAKTDANGLVQTSVTSKTVPTTAVVTAVLASSSAVRAVSNSLNISGGDPVPEAFQIVAEEYNLDGRFVGDTTKVSAFVGDINGNPVPDGFAVNFTTDAGVVEGGCLTVNGTCSVNFRVQAPYGNGVATITATGEASDVSVSDTLKINMAGSAGGNYQLSEVSSGSPAVQNTTLSNCKQDVVYYLSDGGAVARAVAKGSTVAVATTGGGSAASIKLGSPVSDALDGDFAPTIVVVSYDLSNLTSSKKCTVGGSSTASEASVDFLLKTPNGIEQLQKITLIYPYAPPAP